MLADLTWKTDYDVTHLSELPGSPNLPIFYYPPKGEGGREGVLLQITSRQYRWIGCFASNVPSECIVIAAPRPGWLCVLSAGNFVVVDTADPRRWETSPLPYVNTYLVVPQYRLLLLADDTTVTAYGPEGFLWTSRRVCWDDLRLVSVNGTNIYGFGSDPTSRLQPEGRFILDVFTGEVVGTDFTLE